MPALKTKLGCWEKQWNVGSDEFVIPAFVGIVIRLVCFALIIGVLFYLYFPPSDCEQEAIPPLIYGSLFGLLILETAVMMSETIILSISARGTVMHTKPRRSLIVFLLIRYTLYPFEAVILSVCTYAVYSPDVTDELECDAYHSGPLKFAHGVVITLWVTIAIYFIGFLIFCDPAGCCAPGMLEEMGFLDNEKQLEKRKKQNKEVVHHGSTIDHRRILRKFNALCCCFVGGGQRSRSVALQDVARAFHTVFTDTDVVLTDIVAGMILVNKDQKRKKLDGKCLTTEFRKLAFERIDRKFVPQGYEREDPKKFNFDDVDERLLFEDLVHYMKHCMGIYGWPLHMFDNLACGLCQLSWVTCCVCNFRCVHKRFNVDIFKDNCCLCGVGTMRIQTTMHEEEILLASFDNDLFLVPFTLSVDRDRKSIVLTIRGTLSIKDALTDMSASMVQVDVPGFPSNQTFMHNGMYKTAKDLIKELNKNNSLRGIMNRPEFWDYRLVITGHSLGAGVASILALLLKPDYPDVTAYVFSPPGCIFSFPLAVYSREFVTSVVFGNDMIPRVSFRSLLYLKRQVINLLGKCKKPKHQILFQPRWCELHCCRGNSEEPSVELNIESEVFNPQQSETDGAADKKTLRQWCRSLACCCGDDRKRTESVATVVTTKRILKQWNTKAKRKGGRHFFVKGVNDGEGGALAFPPGKTIHIQQDKSTKPWFLASCYPGQMHVSWVSSEDLCVILVDRGIVEDHLPTSVLGAMKRCNGSFIQGTYDPAKTRQRRKELLEQFSARRRSGGMVATAEPSSGRIVATAEPSSGGVIAPAELSDGGVITTEMDVFRNGQVADHQVRDVIVEIEDHAFTRD